MALDKACQNPGLVLEKWNYCQSETLGLQKGMASTQLQV